MGKAKNEKFISDFEAQKLLGLTAPVDNLNLPSARKSDKARNPHLIFRIGSEKDPAPDAGDDFALCNLILDFDLIPYRKASGRDDYEMAHEVYENPDDVIFEIGSLAFRRADVDLLRAFPGWKSTEPAAPEHHLKRLAARRENILRLQQSRAQLSLGPSIMLREALAAAEKEIGDFGGIKKPNGEPRSHVARFQVPEGTKWDAVEIEIISNEEARIKAPGLNRLVRYSDLEMNDRRNLRVSQPWGTLLLFAQQTSIGPETPTDIAPDEMSKRVERLGAKLRGAFGIKDRPFTRYRKSKQWVPIFKLKDNRDERAMEQNGPKERDPDPGTRRPALPVCNVCQKRHYCKELCPKAKKFLPEETTDETDFGEFFEEHVEERRRSIGSPKKKPASE